MNPKHQLLSTIETSSFYMRKLMFTQSNSVDRDPFCQEASDYVNLVKYGDSLYQCKYLKVSALRCLCTVKKRVGHSLASFDRP